MIAPDRRAAGGYDCAARKACSPLHHAARVRAESARLWRRAAGSNDMITTFAAAGSKWARCSVDTDRIYIPKEFMSFTLLCRSFTNLAWCVIAVGHSRWHLVPSFKSAGLRRSGWAARAVMQTVWSGGYQTLGFACLALAKRRRPFKSLIALFRCHTMASEATNICGGNRGSQKFGHRRPTCSDLLLSLFLSCVYLFDFPWDVDGIVLWALGVFTLLPMVRHGASCAGGTLLLETSRLQW